MSLKTYAVHSMFIVLIGVCLWWALYGRLARYRLLSTRIRELRAQHIGPVYLLYSNGGAVGSLRSLFSSKNLGLLAYVTSDGSLVVEFPSFGKMYRHLTLMAEETSVHPSEMTVLLRQYPAVWIHNQEFIVAGYDLLSASLVRRALRFGNGQRNDTSVLQANAEALQATLQIAGFVVPS
jgi:hypothetical protein